MKKTVGVMPLWDEKKDSIWMLPGYLDGLQEAGVLPVMFPFTDETEDLRQLVGMCDGFLFTGGHDVSPAMYGEKPMEELVVCCEKRDAMEKKVLEMALEADKPVLGICRGLQFINAVLGGTLYQDLQLQHGNKVCHRQPAPYDVPGHEVDLLEGTPLEACLGADRIAVNSCHHQGVKLLALSLQAMAVADDGLVEAAFCPDRKFLWAVQWHPEFLFRRDENSRRIFRAFAEALG